MLTSFLISSFIITTLALFFLNRDFSEPFISKTWRLSKEKAGKQLYQELLNVNRFYLAKGQTVELTRYKFFTELLDELLKSYRSTGANIFEHIAETRKNLLLDIKQEKKLKTAASSSFAEMAMIFGMSVLFVSFAIAYAEIKIPTIFLIIAFSWQLLGSTCFFWVMRRLRVKRFGPFFSYLKSASFLDIYIKTNRPVNLIAKQLNLAQLPKDKSLEHIKDRMDLILSQIKNQGVYDQQQGRELGLECWFCYEQKLDSFLQEIKKLKLATITLFFLASYLFLFFSLVSTLQAGH
ncbi:MAG: hypothetical protein KC478_08405 [Bacteriovoracaceae bacterium]|nr:hypothetical protein [Bacteriovoracaceae bacterium]